MIVKKNEFFSKKGENKKAMDAKLATFSQFFWKLKFQVKNVRRRRHLPICYLPESIWDVELFPICVSKCFYAKHLP